MRDDERKFSDEQMAVILRRAADIQSLREDSTHSLSEIQEIGRQVGLDPEVVALAAAGVPKRTSLSLASQVRKPRSVVATEFVLARRATSDEIGKMLDAVRRASGHQGNSSQVFDAVEWRSGNEHELIDLSVAITPSSDSTNVRVQYRSETATTLTGLLTGLGSVLGVGVAFSALPLTTASLLSAGIAAAGVTAFRTIRQRFANRGARTLDQIVKAVQEEMG